MGFGSGAFTDINFFKISWVSRSPANNAGQAYRDTSIVYNFIRFVETYQCVVVHTSIHFIVYLYRVVIINFISNCRDVQLNVSTWNM